MCTERDDDYGYDGHLEAAYEERYAIGWEPLDDAEEFERNQLALDNDLDDPYDDEGEDDEDWPEDVDESDLRFYDEREYDPTF